MYSSCFGDNTARRELESERPKTGRGKRPSLLNDLQYVAKPTSVFLLENRNISFLDARHIDLYCGRYLQSSDESKSSSPTNESEMSEKSVPDVGSASQGTEKKYRSTSPNPDNLQEGILDGYWDEPVQFYDIQNGVNVFDSNQILSRLNRSSHSRASRLPFSKELTKVDTLSPGSLQFQGIHNSPKLNMCDNYPCNVPSATSPSRITIGLNAISISEDSSRTSRAPSDPRPNGTHKPQSATNSERFPTFESPSTVENIIPENSKSCDPDNISLEFVVPPPATPEELATQQQRVRKEISPRFTLPPIRTKRLAKSETIAQRLTNGTASNSSRAHRLLLPSISSASPKQKDDNDKTFVENMIALSPEAVDRARERTLLRLRLRIAELDDPHSDI